MGRAQRAAKASLTARNSGATRQITPGRGSEMRRNNEHTHLRKARPMPAPRARPCDLYRASEITCVHARRAESSPTIIHGEHLSDSRAERQRVLPIGRQPQARRSRSARVRRQSPSRQPPLAPLAMTRTSASGAWGAARLRRRDDRSARRSSDRGRGLRRRGFPERAYAPPCRRLLHRQSRANFRGSWFRPEAIAGRTCSRLRTTLPLSRTGGHVSRLPGALVDCCSEAVADRSGSDGQVAAWATNQQSRPRPGGGWWRSGGAASDRPIGSNRDCCK
jgi:hypothetical protein